jgi:hypothetical protein
VRISESEMNVRGLYLVANVLDLFGFEQFVEALLDNLLFFNVTCVHVPNVQAGSPIPDREHYSTLYVHANMINNCPFSSLLPPHTFSFS